MQPQRAQVKVLVVVPSDVLRSQLAERFITLGVLKDKDCRVLSPTAKHPVVCALAHIPKTDADVDAVFERAHVVVTTMNVASGCAALVQERIAPKIADAAVDEQRSLRDFLKGFTEFADEIPLDTVRPATSMVAYRTKCSQWTPDNFRAGIPNLAACERVEHTVNHDHKTLIVVTARRVPLRWTDVEALFDWEWDLYVVAWAEDQGLLYINGSSLSGEYRSLAHAVAGSDAVLLGGQDVFRAFAGINRLRLQNVGLSEQLGRSIRYTGRMGADVEPGISEGQRGKATKSVIAGAGFEGGALVGVGASKKGRIWAHQRGSVDKLVEWCRHVGAKLIDQTIDPDEVMKGTLVPTLVVERPPVMPIALEWPVRQDAGDT